MLYINSKRFMNDFINDVDSSKYNFILISNDIKNKETYPNVTTVKSLIPPNDDIAMLIETGDDKGFEKRYKKYLAKPENLATLAILVKGELEGLKLVLMCSKIEESEFKYIKYLVKFIEDTFKVKVHNYKNFKKDGDKVFKLKNKSEAKKIVTKILEKSQGCSTANKVDMKINKEKVYDKLKKLSTKELTKLCKKNGIKIKDNDKKKDIVNRIVKKIY